MAREEVSQARVEMLANDIGCGILLAKDLLILAGGDEGLVRWASTVSKGINQMKAIIIDARFKKVEK